MYQVRTTTTAIEQLRNIQNPHRRSLRDKIRGLAQTPDQQGKPLRKKLKDYRSIPGAGRYRIVYRVTDDDADPDEGIEGTVYVEGVGIRKAGDKKDIYNIIEKNL